VNFDGCDAHGDAIDASQSQFNRIDIAVTDYPPSNVWNYRNTFPYLSEKVSSEQLLLPPTLL
jgi:hypothetical protein